MKLSDAHDDIRRRASAAPLFDRFLCAIDRSEGDGSAGGQGLKDFVLRDLRRLLNSRTHLKSAAFIAIHPMLLDYGIPDFSGYSLQDRTEQDILARMITLAIGRFEPRLANVSVAFNNEAYRADQKNGPFLRISAELKITETVIPVQFEVIAAKPDHSGDLLVLYREER